MSALSRLKTLASENGESLFCRSYFLLSKAVLRARYLRFGIGLLRVHGLLHLRQNAQDGLKPLWVLDDYRHSALAFRNGFVRSRLSSPKSFNVS